MASNGFEVSFIALSNPPEDLDPAPFQATVGFPNGTQAFRIKHGTSVLKVVPVSAHSPTAQILEPQNGEIISGTTTVQWQSSDQDGDTLYHTLEYSHNGTDWQVLTSNITTTQTMVNFDALPGSTQAYLRLFVTDGINTTQATSQPFIIAAKPPQVFITYPSDGTNFAFGQNITFVGNAYDPQDGSLFSDSALQWTSDRDGVLGQGYTLNIGSLSSGNHTITLIATDSLGMVSSASIVIHIINITNLYLPVISKR